MININTILSTFDDQGTLLKWLKTTNNALKNASLKSVEAVQPTATTLQLKFIFADDSSLLSPPITLPSGGAFKNDPLFFKTDNYLTDLSNTEKEEFNLLIEKSFTENRPIIISCPESYFFQLQSIDARIYFIGTIDDISQYEMITFYKNKNKKWEIEYDITLNYSCEFLWNFSEDKNYSINAHIGSISTDLVLKQNELNNEQKMSYIYGLFNTNAIISLSLNFDSKFHKIIEITFENQTDYTFYYLENGVIKSVVIDVSIIQ